MKNISNNTVTPQTNGKNTFDRSPIITQIEAFFIGFFEKIEMEGIADIGVFVKADRGNKQHNFIIRNWENTDMLHHELENIKGDIVRGEQTVLIKKK